MITAYLFRHAESAMNTRPELIGGRSNEALLTPRGIEQAHKLGLWIAQRELVPDTVLVSPAVRTLETMRISLESAGIIVSHSIDYRLQELSQGIKEGTLRAEEYTPAVLEQINRELKDFKFEGGDSMNDVAGRMDEVIQEQITGDTGATLFIYTHGFAVRTLIGKYLGWDHLQIRKNEMDNAAATILGFEDGQLVHHEFNVNTQFATAA